VEVGNCPYRVIRPVLFACQPDQLAHIEDCSPHIMLDSDEIWALFLTRDFPNEAPVVPAGDTSGSGTSPGPSHPAVEAEEGGVREVDLPPNRVHYFKTRLAKEEALASASARLREKVQASRSDQHKRKAIFTGLTDYGVGSKKKKLNGSKSWGSYTPAGKTLAEKARQQVKKSAAVYANAVRAKAALISTPNSAPQFLARTQTGPGRTSAPIFSIRKQPLGRAPSPTCVLRASAAQPQQVKVVQVPTALAPTTPPSLLPAIKPTPFPQPKPSPQSFSGPLTTPLLRKPPPKTPSLPVVPASSNKSSSLFMPKKLKPPPPQPCKSLIHRAGPSSNR